jgi:hypothetical protein
MKEFLEAITWFNLEIIELVMQGILISITKKMVVEMLKLLKTCISKLLTKPTKEKKKEKEAVIYQKIAQLEALIDREG